MTAAVSVRELRKTFGRQAALDGVSFDVPAGSLYGLLGPNGAGKTTLFSIAAGFLKPTSGRIEVLGVDIGQISRLRGRFSMLPQDARFQSGIPVVEQLVMFCRLNGLDSAAARAAAQRALEIVGLGAVGRKSARALSHGMLKRVALCQAFLGEPEVVFLDEPTSGLDPDNARQIRDLVRAMRGTKTVVFSSHNLQEVQDLCDHVAILDEGLLKLAGSMAELTASSFLLRIGLPSALAPATEAALAALPVVERIDRSAATPLEINVRLRTRGGEGKDAATKAIYDVLAAHNQFPRSLHEGASLETLFLEITGGAYDGASSR